MTWKGVEEPLIKSYDQILNLNFENLSAISSWENGSLLMEKAKLLMEKGSQPPET